MRRTRKTWRVALGSQIAQARRTAKLTQKQLAGQLGLSKTMLGNYERGDASATLDVLAFMATKFGAKFNVGGWVLKPEVYEGKFNLVPKQMCFSYDQDYSLETTAIRVSKSGHRVVFKATGTLGRS